MFSNKIDEKIIDFLRNDSRESFVDIGKKLKLSESAVRRRVRNLVANGTIKKFTVEVGDKNTTSAIVLISVDSTIDTSKVSVKLTKLEGVKTVYEITGQYDITVIISAPNIAEINSCIDALRKIPGVIDTNTVIILRTVS
ncbi:MAG: HTH-type transcriptional regulator LysM [Nitrosopumilales archaeon]|nr:MAG: HTH-type transcriptional regulator LysM [Nitrosopumilales archaeon]